MILVLLKAGFSYSEILDMTEETAMNFLELYAELRTGKKTKTYYVKRKK